MTTATEVKGALLEEFARIAKAVAQPRRLELLDLLAQGERSVDALAALTRMSAANTSAHLQVLRNAQLVDARRAGTRVYYQLAGDDVAELLDVLRRVAAGHLAEVDRLARDFFGARDNLEPITPRELRARMRVGDVIVLDVRPAEEYAAGHIPGAISIPLEDLDERLDELDPDAEIVAYCRNRHCVLAPAALERLHERGIRARRLDEGFPEWRGAGLPVSGAAVTTDAHDHRARS